MGSSSPPSPTQLNRRFSHVPNLIREVTALRWESTKFDSVSVESATETVENSTYQMESLLTIADNLEP